MSNRTVEQSSSKNLLDRLRSAALTRGPLASVSVDKNDLLALVEWADKHGASTETSERHRGDDIDPKIAQQAWYHIQQLAVTDPSLWVRMAVQRVFQLMRPAEETEPALEDQFREHRAKDNTGCDL